jgi:hypothetical protein
MTSIGKMRLAVAKAKMNEIPEVLMDLLQNAHKGENKNG